MGSAESLGLLQWRHNVRDGVLNHQAHDCLFYRVLKTQMKENIKAERHWPLWGKFTGVTGEFPAQRDSNAENVSILWRYHAYTSFKYILRVWWAMLQLHVDQSDNSDCQMWLNYQQLPRNRMWTWCLAGGINLIYLISMSRTWFFFTFLQCTYFLVNLLLTKNLPHSDNLCRTIRPYAYERNA